MIDFSTANDALKTVYLGVLSNVLNLKLNPFFAKIKHSTKGVYGKEVKILAPVGINGGICATSETGELPKINDAGYVTLTTTLKNLYGRIEITDKAIRASQSSAGAFVNLLNEEMERLIEASTYNLSRMLYGNGSGLITELSALSTDKKTITVSNAAAFTDGMVIDIYEEATSKVPTGASGFKIVCADRANNKLTLDKEVSLTDISDGGYYAVLQNSLNNELTGIEALFDTTITKLYGLSKGQHRFLCGMLKPNYGTLTEIGIITELDKVEANSGNPVNLITCNPDVRRKYQSILITANKPMQTVDIEGGFKALDFYGKPLIADKFADSACMYLLNTNDFALHQLCDWEWMSDESGNILTQKSGYAAYSATLVKYADLVCTLPFGQGKLSAITVS